MQNALGAVIENAGHTDLGELLMRLFRIVV